MSKNFKNILIIKPSSLGDIVLALPALTALRRSFPDAKISWLIRPEFAPLIENHPHLDRVILFDRKFLGKAWYNFRAMQSLLSFIRNLRHSSFDAVIDLQGLFRTAALAQLTGSGKRFGMANAREFAHIFYSHTTPQDSSCIHLVDYYMKIVQNAGVSADNTDVQFVFPDDATAVETVKNLLKSKNIDYENYAVFIPGSAHRHKCWPCEYFSDLAKQISSRFELPVVITGLASERDIAEKLKAMTQVPMANLAGLTNLTELLAVLKTAKLVVSNDTGPGHIAAALGRPMVMIFGQSNPVRVHPYNRSHCVAAIESDKRGPKIKSSNPKHNIDTVTVDCVYRKICEQMK